MKSMELKERKNKIHERVFEVSSKDWNKLLKKCLDIIRKYVHETYGLIRGTNFQQFQGNFFLSLFLFSPRSNLISRLGNHFLSRILETFPRGRSKRSFQILMEGRPLDYFRFPYGGHLVVCPGWSNDRAPEQKKYRIRNQLLLSLFEKLRLRSLLSILLCRYFRIEKKRKYIYMRYIFTLKCKKISNFSHFRYFWRSKDVEFLKAKISEA